MAMVIHGGERELNMFLGGEPHPSMLQYMRDKVEQLGDYVRDTGSRFAQNVINSYENYYSDTALSRARTALQKVKTFFQSDKIYELHTIEEVQQANAVMRRYIMADPVLYNMYYKGQCSGYADAGWVDPFPGKVGDDNYNYRRVMNGQLQLEKPTEDQPDGNWQFVVYVEELMEGDRELEGFEQKAIISTWKRNRHTLANSMKDPSNSLGGML